jgi:hypothetical protein
MKFESFDILKKEKAFDFEKLGKSIEPFFEKYLQELKEKGAPLREDGRIEMTQFETIFGKRFVSSHYSRVETLKRKFGTTDKERDFLEIFIPLILRRWFPRLIPLRTSEYDDYFNKIDHLILDEKTLKILGAIDTTTGWKEKVKDEKILKIIKHGAQAFYGTYYTQEGKFSLGSLNELPTFIIAVSPGDIITTANDYLKGETSEKAKRKVLESLITQSKEFQKICKERMKTHYQLCEKIFEEL